MQPENNKHINDNNKSLGADFSSMSKAGRSPNSSLRFDSEFSSRHGTEASGGTVDHSTSDSFHNHLESSSEISKSKYQSSPSNVSYTQQQLYSSDGMISKIKSDGVIVLQPEIVISNDSGNATPPSNASSILTNSPKFKSLNAIAQQPRRKPSPLKSETQNVSITGQSLNALPIPQTSIPSKSLMALATVKNDESGSDQSLSRSIGEQLVINSSRPPIHLELRKVQVKPLSVIESQMKLDELGVKEDETVDDEDISRYLIYTKSVKKPTLFNVAKQSRTIIRFLQLCCSLGGFIGLAYNNFIYSRPASLYFISGSDFYTFISVTSIFITLSNLFIYTFPAIVGVPPHRHHRVSVVEAGIDLTVCLLWLVGSLWVTLYGRCTRHSISPVEQAMLSNLSTMYYCEKVIIASVCGFGAVVLYALSFGFGLRDLGGEQEDRNGLMFARGNWDK